MGGHPYHDFWPSWLAESGPWTNPNRVMDQRSVDLVHRFLRRPAEELYYLPEDPYSMNNLAEDLDYRAVQIGLSNELDAWMSSQGDPGALIDNETDWRAARAGNHFQPLTKR